MLSRDTIKTCESLRYSGYYDRNQLQILLYLGWYLVS